MKKPQANCRNRSGEQQRAWDRRFLAACSEPLLLTRRCSAALKAGLLSTVGIAYKQVGMSEVWYSRVTPTVCPMQITEEGMGQMLTHAIYSRARCTWPSTSGTGTA